MFIKYQLFQKICSTNSNFITY